MSFSKRTIFPLLLAAAASLDCTSSSSSPPATLDDGLPPTCSPLRAPGACMLPWPNAIYLNPDPSTKTGFRVALAKETLPAANGTPLDPARYNLADGFSPATPILAYFPERIDPASLVSWRDESPSVSPDSATILVDMTTNQRVLHMSEVDANVHHEDDRQALVLRPSQRLAPGHRYAVGITKRLRTLAGGPPASPPLWSAIAGGHAEGELAQKQAARMPEILAALGVAKDDLVVAWDFVTGSDEALTSHVLTMRDQALAAAGASGIGYTIASVEDNPTPRVLRRIRGTFTAPLFLTSGDETKPETDMVFDDRGAPKQNGTYEAPFVLIVPASAKTKGPLPLLFFGHGLFGSGEIALADGGYVQDFADERGYVVFSTDWIGLSAHEDPVKPKTNGAAGDALADFNKMPWLTDRLQQALVSAMVLVRTVRGKIAHDPALQNMADATKLTYYGASLGGIMGTSFMAYDPDVTLGVLHVPGGFWSTMFERSSNWRESKLILNGPYPDILDEQVLMALLQMQLDYSDPATVAPYIVQKPLPGVPEKKLLFQMAVGDAQVPNLATEMMARTMGVPLLGPSAASVFGVTPANGPLPRALTAWDIHPQPMPPDTNETPTADNAAHTQSARIPALNDQIVQFFDTGQITNTCGGPCDFPGFASDYDAGL